MRVRLAMVLIGAGLVLGACASTGSTGSRSSRDVITSEQIDAYEGHNTLLLVQALHPNWLRGRGSGSMMLSDAVRVYVNGMRRGGVRALEGIHPRDVAEIQHLSSREATARFGTGHPNGAILVTLK